MCKDNLKSNKLRRRPSSGGICNSLFTAAIFSVDYVCTATMTNAQSRSLTREEYQKRVTEPPLVTYNTLGSHGVTLTGLDVLVVHVAVDNKEIEATKQKGKKSRTQKIRTPKIVFAIDWDGTEIANTYPDDVLANMASTSTAQPGHAFIPKPPRAIGIWKQVGLPIFGVEANDTMIPIRSTKQYVFNPYVYFANAQRSSIARTETTRTYAACLLKDIKVVGLNEDSVEIYVRIPYTLERRACPMCLKAKGGAQTFVKFEFGGETPKEEELDFELVGRRLLTWLKEEYGA